MKKKSERLLAIRKLIKNEKISSQEALLRKLKDDGYSMTQATLSRDLKYLRVSKIYDPVKGMIYSLPDSDQGPETTINGFLADGFLSVEYSQGLGVLRTLPGYASSIASAIDTMNIPEIAGTIAGDDTILIILRDGAIKDELNEQLSVMFNKSLK